MEPDTTAADELGAFIDAAPSPYHAVAEASARLERAGFSAVDLGEAFPTGPGGHFVRVGGALVAWRQTGAAPTSFRIVGAHTDSPNLRIKPVPDRSVAGVRQLGVEVYGGALVNSWLDRDLGLSGRVSVRVDGAIDHRLFRIDEALLRVPQLAIHLDREIREKGLLLDPQQHLSPIWDVGDIDEGGFRTLLAEVVGVDGDDVLAWDAMVHDLTPSARLGRDGVFLAAPRLDNLCSSWAGIEALLAATESGDAEATATPVVCLYDHEEVGSTSSTGADATLLVSVLERLTVANGGDRETLARAAARSTCVSADMAHATHPNYLERHEPDHEIHLNGGVVVKVNANQRYASDATSIATIVDVCERAGVPVQRFVNRTDLPCGSTIGPTTAARLGISTVDVGVAQLSMHSARELCGAEDPAYYRTALGAFLGG